jgi:predicted CoA-binding protein
MAYNTTLACDISMNTKLSPSERALYQNSEQIRDLLHRAENIAIVGLSDKKERASNFVGSYLKSEGYKVIPVNPLKQEILGEKCYPDLRSVVVKNTDPDGLRNVLVGEEHQQGHTLVKNLPTGQAGTNVGGGKIDIVDIFRRPDECVNIVKEAIEVGAKAIWMQLGIVNREAAELAIANGLIVVMDRCMKMEHGRYSGALHWAGMNTEIVTARKAGRFI